jgi:hypothetical protein
MSCVVLDIPTGRISTLDDAAAVGAHASLVLDTLFVVADTDIVPLYAGDVVAGTWRTKLVVLRERPGFAWLRVNGPFDDDVIVRTYADGTLFDTVTITDREPIRMPDGAFSRWEVEIESASQVTSVRLASTAEELR